MKKFSISHFQTIAKTCIMYYVPFISFGKKTEAQKSHISNDFFSREYFVNQWNEFEIGRKLRVSAASMLFCKNRIFFHCSVSLIWALLLPFPICIFKWIVHSIDVFQSLTYLTSMILRIVGNHFICRRIWIFSLKSVMKRNILSWNLKKKLALQSKNSIFFTVSCL